MKVKTDVKGSKINLVEYYGRRNSALPSLLNRLFYLFFDESEKVLTGHKIGL